MLPGGIYHALPISMNNLCVQGNMADLGTLISICVYHYPSHIFSPYCRLHPPHELSFRISFFDFFLPLRMAGVILGVGTGVFVLAVVWVVTLLLCVLLSRASGAARFLVALVFLMALVVTLILVFFPRASETATSRKETQIVDTFFIGRYFLVSVMSVIFLGSTFLAFAYHILEPVYAKPLRIS
uniref:Transmembrane protein 218 n=1 Tax=Leptobrachium leishanense TaxID=445787 RepID=A0A8C5PPX8_9ANUR